MRSGDKSSGALILVDLQKDFMPGGSLAVGEGDAVVPIANRLLRDASFELKVATKDWHPRGHGSFASSHPGRKPGDMATLAGLPQVLWPDHCVQESPGAEFHEALDAAALDRVFLKGTDPAIDSYSGFFDNGHRKATGLGDYLKAKGIGKVAIMGLATDYCVKFTALDSVGLGFQTILLAQGCRGVDLKPGDSRRAIEEMRAKGITVVEA